MHTYSRMVPTFCAIMRWCHGKGVLRHNTAIVHWGRGGPIRKTDCSLTVTLPALVPTALPPTERWPHPPAEGPGCTGPYCHRNQKRLQCIFHAFTIFPSLTCWSVISRSHLLFVGKTKLPSEFVTFYPIFPPRQNSICPFMQICTKFLPLSWNPSSCFQPC